MVRGTRGVRVHPHWPLVWLGSGLLALQVLALLLHERWDADYAFVALVLISGGIYLLAVRVVARSAPRRGVFAIVLAFAVLPRLLLLVGPTLHSTDAYRYVWDGRVQAAGFNPYRFVPADPALADLRDEAVYPRINRADYAVTIYPPVAQTLFLALHFLGDSLLGLKIGLLVIEGLAMWLLARLLTLLGRRREHLIAYAWHPLPLWEIAGDAHVDVGMMVLLLVALLATAFGRRLLAGAALAGSVLFKPITLAALPAFWRPWDWRVPIGFAAAALVFYLPYLDVGSGVLGFLVPYTGEEGLVDGRGFFLLALLERLGGSLPPFAHAAYLLAALSVLGGLALACVRDRRRDLATLARQVQLLLFTFLLLLSPNYPWYFLVLVPLSCLVPWSPVAALTLAAIVLYAAPPIDGRAETLAAQAALHAVVAAALVFELYRYLTRDHHSPVAVPRGPVQ